MALSTTQSIWRSGGGDNTRTAYCGSGVMAATFYVDGAMTVDDTPAKVTATNSAPIILPAGAVVVSINFRGNVTGVGPTFDLGLNNNSGSTYVGLVDAGDATANETIDLNTTNALSVIGTNYSPDSLMTVIARVSGTWTSGAVTGQILYYVTDPLGGQQNV